MPKKEEQENKTDSHDVEDVKANFLATMSHEMRTPMQSIYGFLELIELEDTSDHVKEMVKVAKTSASTLLEILDDVLEFSKMDAGKMALDDFEVPLRTLVRGVYEALSVKIHGKDIELLDHFDDDVPFVIKGDPKRLRQILMNLVGNALKFTKTGHILISVRVSSAPETPTAPLKIMFEISDTGIGISEKHCAQLFEPFHQADNSTAREYGGTGLGLSICKKLVDLMQGEIGVTSVEEKGSTFWFEIPTQAVDIEHHDSEIDLKLSNLTGLSILSVEDHPKGAQEIVNSLSSMGASVESCATIKEALELMKIRPFDVGIIDQGLPDGDGLSLIRKIINLYPFMGCLMYTARDDTGLKNSLQSLGVEYIAKPASRRGLGEAVLDASSKVSKNKTGHVSKRLLLAEDTASVRDILKRQLEVLNIEADIVENGQDVLDALEKKDYGLLITDLHMPDIDGYDVIRTLRDKEASMKEEHNRLPVIALTADIQIADRQVYLKYGFDECLLKPVTLGHFKRLLIRWGVLNLTQEEMSQPASSLTHQDSAQNSDHSIDLKALEQQLGAIDGMAMEMLTLFVTMTEPLVDQLQKEGGKKNISQIHELAHSLKGSSRSAGALKMGMIAAEIQEQAKNDTVTPHTMDLIDHIVQEFENVKQHIIILQTQYK